MKAMCSLHGPTTIIGTNAYGFPVYACCCEEVPYVTPRTHVPGRRRNADLTGSSNPNNRRRKRNDTDDRPAACVLIRSMWTYCGATLYLAFQLAEGEPLLRESR